MGRKIPRGILLAILGTCGLSSAETPPRPGSARLIEKENNVDARVQGTAWKAANVGLGLNTGDRLRTGEFSRAAIRFTDLSVLRLDELTNIQVLPPADRLGKRTLDVQRGGTYFFSREKANDLQIRTPAANGALRGTEFAVRVAAGGRTTFTVYEGEVDMANAQGRVLLKAGEQGEADIGKAPRKTAVIDATNIIQWCLYYPAVLDPSEIPLGAAERERFAGSLAAYRAGDLPGALAKSQGVRGDGPDGVRLYRAAVMLSTGQVEKARAELRGTGANDPLRQALEQMISAVQHKEWKTKAEPRTASGWMAESYYRQSRGNLDAARKAARKAAAISPGFGFAWVRVAELEFSSGRTREALAALDRGLQLAPRNARAHALQGFLRSAENRMGAARSSFEEAIALDGALGDAWLGRGLTFIREGREEQGRADLQTAAAIEPNRSILRSYLGKGFSEVGNVPKAGAELKRAIELDPDDPTPWLYSAIERKQENRYNEAVADLERSVELNDNRRLYRSRFLLDEDLAVRGANLASIYLNAGLREQSVREAVRAVASDPGSAPAHLFLSNSYNALRDPSRVQLRYETAWFNELLLSNLLSPVGAGPLSQFVSAQEYSKLFEKDGLGVSSLFEYLGTGQVREIASQYGTFGNISYALDADYQYDPGVRVNNQLSRFEGAATFKLQLGPQNSLFLKTEFVDLWTGDRYQRYNQNDANFIAVTQPDGSGGTKTTYVRNRAAQSLYQREIQDPGLILAGWHHQWSPGNHTLLLLGRLATRQTFTVDSTGVPLVYRDVAPFVPPGWENEVGVTIPRDARFFSTMGALTGMGDITNRYAGVFDLDYRSQFESYSAEAQQILTLGPNTLLFGARFQRGQFDTQVSLTNYNNGAPAFEAPAFQNPPAMQDYSVDFERVNLYLYDTLKVTRWLTIIGGVAYDSLDYPDNFRSPPINGEQADISKVSPKVGLILQPWGGATVRAAYLEGITGASFDESVRLEPTQVAGFLQAYRTLAPESIIGSISGSTLRVAGVSFEQKLPSHLYLGIQFERLQQNLDRTVGVFDSLDSFGTPLAIMPSSIQEKIRYEEDILTASINKLIGENWSLGASYRYTKSDLSNEVPAFGAALAASQVAGWANNLARSSRAEAAAALHQLSLHAIFNHPSGFFARAEANYYQQANTDYVRSATLTPGPGGTPRAIVTTTVGGLPGDNFWQFNLLAGFRFYRNQCEISTGVLNLTGRDYRLSPVNPYEELPRERTFVVRCKLNF